MHKPDQQFCFTHSSGEDIYLFVLRNAKGTEVAVTNYGAIITSFRVVRKDGAVNDIVLGFDDVKEYLGKEYLSAYPYFGAAIGRYGNRIRDGEFSIDGKAYAVKRNLGADHLHGGSTGFDKVVWHCDSFTGNSLTLGYQSRDGEEGYPGSLNVTLRFDLSEDDQLSHEYTAVTDQPTIVNLTHHSYFNLNNGKGTIGDHFVKINASNILEQDARLNTTGKLIPVKCTAHDFTQLKKINKDWDEANGYDQSFVVDNNDGSVMAEAYSEESGTRLQIFTTEPIVHLYTGRWIPSVRGRENTLYGPYSGFCLETQVHPNAINIPHFPNTILRPGEKYHQKTVYKII
jgi:aldose 1-epimerase